MVRGIFDESKTLSDLASNDADYFSFLSHLLSLEEEGLLTFTTKGERTLLKSAVVFLEMLTPAELNSVKESDSALVNRFPSSRYGMFEEYRMFLEVLGLDAQPLAIEVDVPWPDGMEATYPATSQTFSQAASPDAATPPEDFSLVVVPTLSSCLEKGKEFLSAGWPGLARDRFVEAIKIEPRSTLAMAYLAWMDYQKNPRSPELRRQVEQALDKTLDIYDDNDDMLTFRGMLFKLDGNLKEAEHLLRRAVAANPKHNLALCQLRILTHRQMESEEWPAIDFRTIRLDAPIIIQRRVMGKTKVYCFDDGEIRIGSSEQDQINVSATTLPHLAKRHCVVLTRDGRHYVRRVASLGRVWINGREIDVRKDEPVLPNECVRLGQTLHGPALELRIFDLKGMTMPGEG